MQAYFIINLHTIFGEHNFFFKKFTSSPLNVNLQSYTPVIVAPTWQPNSVKTVSLELVTCQSYLHRKNQLFFSVLAATDFHGFSLLRALFELRNASETRLFGFGSSTLVSCQMVTYSNAWTQPMCYGACTKRGPCSTFHDIALLRELFMQKSKNIDFLADNVKK